MKILIATGIFPPDIGGPAVFTKILLDELPRHGLEVKLVTYSDESEKDLDRFRGADSAVYKISRQQNILARYFKYFWQINKLAKWVDVIYAFDLISVGLPCAAVKIFNPKVKLAVRLGGDHQWEAAIAKGLYRDSLRQYYIDEIFGWWERTVYFLSNFVLKRAERVIFNSNILRDIYVKYRKIDEKKTEIIKNIEPVIRPEIKERREKDYLNILYAGRLVAFKNLPSLIKAFAVAEKYFRPKWLVLEIIGEGPEKKNLINYIKESGLSDRVKILPKLERWELLNKILDSDVMAMVSLTEVNSNFIIESLTLKKPVVLSKESEERHIGNTNSLIYYADPLSAEDIAAQIKAAIEDVVAARIKPSDRPAPTDEKKIAWGIKEVVVKHLEVFNKL